MLTYDDVELPDGRLADGCAPSSTGTSAARRGSRSGCSSPRDARTDALDTRRCVGRNEIGASVRCADVEAWVGERMTECDVRREAGDDAVKVVIFCGGLGVRMGEETQRIPKPMITVGGRPILWHIMKWYASWGHDDFVLCLGYKGECIKEYFLNYNEALSNDFVLSNGGRDVELLGSDISNWRITFVDTGAQSTIAERLLAVAPHLGDDEYFLATYGDGLTDAPLPDMIERLESSGKTGLFISVRPMFNAHVVARRRGRDRSLDRGHAARRRLDQRRLHGPSARILDYINPGEELVDRAVRALIERGRADRVSVRGLLGADGHDQGQAAARRARRERQARPGDAPASTRR